MTIWLLSIALIAVSVLFVLAVHGMRLQREMLVIRKEQVDQLWIRVDSMLEDLEAYDQIVDQLLERDKEWSELLRRSTENTDRALDVVAARRALDTERGSHYTDDERHYTWASRED